MSDDVDDVLGVLRGDLPPIASTPRKRNQCPHRRSLVDREDRRVTCRDCGVDLDPIEVISQIARVGDQYERAIKAVAESHARLAELERRERNAKARVRRLEARCAS